MYKNLAQNMRLILITIGILSSSAAFSQQLAESEIFFKPADESNVSIFLVLKKLPDQYFLFTIPEIFTGKNLGKGLFNGDLKPWSINGNYGTRSVKNSKYSYTVELKLNEIENEYWLAWTIKFKNKSKASLHDLAAFNCLTMDRAPHFKDTTMSRTWAKDQFDKPILLKNIQKTSGGGRRTMQFYPVIGGIDLAESPWINGWDVNATTRLSGNSVWLESVDGNWKIETIVDGQPAFFFNNWEADHGCIHSSPLLAKELKPGEMATASGRFRFFKLKN